MSAPQQVLDLIAQSGNSFHARVARVFRDAGWTVTVSPYYMDQTQQKSRELDLVVEKLHSTPAGLLGKHTSVVTRLFVECKFVPGHGVFWFTQKNSRGIESLVCRNGPFRENNSYTQQHHYLQGNRAAKLFASSPSRGSQEQEPFYKALNQALTGLVAMRNQTPLCLERRGRSISADVVLDFPVVVCSSFSELYAADFDDVHPVTPIRDNFQLEVQYAYLSQDSTPRNELFVLDFVEFDRLTVFLTQIEEDAKLAAFFSADD